MPQWRIGFTIVFRLAGFIIHVEPVTLIGRFRRHRFQLDGGVNIRLAWPRSFLRRGSDVPRRASSS